MSKKLVDGRSAPARDERSSKDPKKLLARKHGLLIGTVALVVMLIGGVFAKNQWFPRTDAFTGKKYSWFGKPLAKNASSSWNPLAAPLPTPTPSLSKEYIYAGGGGRLLSVVDSNAQEAPPADLAIWRPSTGGWWVLGSAWTQAVNQNWGISTDTPLPGDYDGDGKTDFAVYRSTNFTWYIVYSSDSTTGGYSFGAASDLPAPADYDGDGKTESALFRPSEGKWYIRLDDSGSNVVQQQFGASGDVVAPADYDGDGRADIGLWRASDKTFYSINSSNNLPATLSHTKDGVPVSADYDGDGKADYATYDSAGGNWHIRQSSNAHGLLDAIQWGMSTDKVVHNDYDGDGKCDIAVWRPANGTWYIKQSASGTVRYEQFGVQGDIPVPAIYRR